MSDTNTITGRNVLMALEDGKKSVDELSEYLGHRCDMGHYHNTDKIAMKLRNLHNNGKVKLTVDRRYAINDNENGYYTPTNHD